MFIVLRVTYKIIIIVVSTYTHTHKPKEFFFSNQKFRSANQFDKSKILLSKIVFVVMTIRFMMNSKNNILISKRRL